MTMLFTEAMLHKLVQANESVKGTSYYNKYHMENSHKWEGKKGWHFDGFSIPHVSGTILYFNHKIYIKVTQNGYTDRWVVNPEVRELLDLP